MNCFSTFAPFCLHACSLRCLSILLSHLHLPQQSICPVMPQYSLQQLLHQMLLHNKQICTIIRRILQHALHTCLVSPCPTLVEQGSNHRPPGPPQHAMPSTQWSWPHPAHWTMGPPLEEWAWAWGPSGAGLVAEGSLPTLASSTLAGKTTSLARACLLPKGPTGKTFHFPLQFLPYSLGCGASCDSSHILA